MSLPPRVLDQTSLPLVAAIAHQAQRPHAPFYTPGHKQGQGASLALQTLLGTAALQADLPELLSIGNLFVRDGAIATAQNLAADAFGAEQTWFLVNGSSGGLIAAILATCAPGDKLILPRNGHQSLITGLIFTGAQPIFVSPDYDVERDLAYGITPAAVEAALQQHPDAKAVLAIYPTYHGIGCDLGAIAAIAHRHNCPLLVDEAHGAHFGFHPDLPPTALELGADLSVQSTHKVLGALTQAAMLHVQGDRLDRDRLDRALQFVQSTSPNYLLLASLDAARQQMACQGEAQLAATLALAAAARSQLIELPQLRLLAPPSSPTPGFTYHDPTRLTVLLNDWGIDGFTADQQLDAQFGVVCELPMLQHITFIITLGNRTADIERLVTGFAHLQAPTPTLPPPRIAPLTTIPVARLTPRAAHFARPQSVPVAQAIGQISAALICPYPPGIPVLVPGEVITAEAIAYLQAIQQQGGIITGSRDPDLQSFAIVSE
ncbi:MAG: aminotransferase class I/II-fold pyridoxal phosphate-dependent enzyme [Spirulinaceae cyanobacterium SM2_1_0]|nr:aminotransferase class I/II-fold pyridoxal phosphate-dependent enzyme [Spirulinaceae cyanobacterium SM2_1_0]